MTECPKCGKEMDFQGSCADDVLRDFYNCLSCNIHWSHGSDIGWQKEGKAERPNCYFSMSTCLWGTICIYSKRCSKRREKIMKKDPVVRIAELEAERHSILDVHRECEILEEEEFLKKMIVFSAEPHAKPETIVIEQSTSELRIKALIEGWKKT